ncbi:hypothetical protein MPSEU_000283000 [Mayamaea pseudoterrestris]|nr:hypothetical protein MPSEU_000283000 [Mayamaea pseudoterrestris]
MAYRYCASCGRNLPGESYSNNQWNKGDGISRCGACVHQKQPANQSANVAVVNASQTARLNDAYRATFTSHDLDHPFAQGSFRWVAKGKYTEGNRAGQQCVCKWFKTGGVMESRFYDADLSAAEEAIRMVSKWNSHKLVNRMVRVNKPEVWTFDNDARASWARKKVLQEPFITDYQKFNSNTGWSDDSIPWSRVMQALSHFCYHYSSGQTLLCDLQGGVYQDGVVLTDPVIMSLTPGKYGPTDLGPNGTSTFFHHHKCNEFCRSNWRKPRNCTPYFKRTAGTTMDIVPTRRSRQPMSAMGAVYE